MQTIFETMVTNPWRAAELFLDGPLHPGGEEATERLLDRTSVDEGTTLVDIGCGRGESVRLARERGARAVGLDRDPTNEVAIEGDMADLPFRNRSFDVVLGECVLCLSPDLGETLTEIERVLKPGGRLGFSDVTVEGDPPTLPSPFDDFLCLAGPREPSSIRRRIRDAGFEIEDSRTHRDDLLEMRDRIRAGLDTQRLERMLGETSTQLGEGARELERAVESGEIGYVSIVARK